MKKDKYGFWIIFFNAAIAMMDEQGWGLKFWWNQGKLPTFLACAIPWAVLLVGITFLTILTWR
jgi:hypothetical protein